MKVRQTILVFLIVLVTCFIVSAQSLNNSPLPAPTGMVNDYANIIDDTVQAQIEQKLRDFKAKTNPPVEIAVVTVKTTGERPIFDYSLAVARGWGIGDKGATNSSLLLIVAVDDRKYFTQVSGGLQDELTDATVGQIQRQNLVPAFRQNDYSKGISATVDAFVKTIETRSDSPNVTPTPTSGTKSKGVGVSTIVCCVVIFIVILIVIMVISNIGGGGKGGSGGSGSGKDRWRGGGFGGAPIVIWGGGGSSSSDWGSSGGGDSWGGFSGGGGGFDGGGAGGDW